MSVFNMQSNIKALSLNDIREFERPILDHCLSLESADLHSSSLPDLFKQFSKIEHYDSELWEKFDQTHEEFFYSSGSQRKAMIGSYYFMKRDERLDLISVDVSDEYERTTTVRDF